MQLQKRSYFCKNKTKKNMSKKALTPQQSAAIKVAKKMATKAINAVFAVTFDNNVRNARYFEIKEIEANTINQILNN